MLKIKTVTIGNEKHAFAFSGDTIWDCVREEGKHVFNDIPKCGKCGSKNLSLRAFYPQEEFKYLKVICYDCKASLTFGNPKKSPGVYYPRRTEEGEFKWESYEPKE